MRDIVTFWLSVLILAVFTAMMGASDWHYRVWVSHWGGDWLSFRL
jgi:hypothetical protein